METWFLKKGKKTLECQNVHFAFYMGKLICRRNKQSLSSYRIAPNGNKKRAGSIQQQNVMDHYGRDQKAIRYNGNIV